MKLWLLLPIDRKAGPWNPWYDKTFGFVIQAETDFEARLLAHNDAGDENRTGEDPWLSPNLSSCLELTPDPDNPPTIILKDFAAA